jgi:hypothetical protein
MIGPGSMPRYRPRGLRRPTLAYTRMRKRTYARTNKQAPSAAGVNTEIVAFDHGPAEFPVATLRPRNASARMTALVGALEQWLAARWQWFRPRTLPCAVACLGMLAVMASADYLAHYQAEHVHQAPQAVHIDLASR